MAGTGKSKQPAPRKKNAVQAQPVKGGKAGRSGGAKPARKSGK